jgi:hypothetical protein
MAKNKQMSPLSWANRCLLIGIALLVLPILFFKFIDLSLVVPLVILGVTIILASIVLYLKLAFTDEHVDKPKPKNKS